VVQHKGAPLRHSRATRWRSSTVEHLICNQAVVGSIPIASFMHTSGHSCRASGEVPERPKGADCKSAGVSLRRFESSPLHRREGRAGIAQMARASAFQAEGRGFESRFPLCGRSPIDAHLLRCSVARLCGVAPATPPRSLPRALHLGISRRPACNCRMVACRASRVSHTISHPIGWEPRWLGRGARGFRGLAQVAQLAEHVLGKDEVGGSIPLLGFRYRECPEFTSGYDAHREPQASGSGLNGGSDG
jgi:hypothetical protein